MLIFLAARASSSLVRRPSIAHLSSSENHVYDLGPIRDEPFDAVELYESPGASLTKKEGEVKLSDQKEEPQ